MNDLSPVIGNNLALLRHEKGLSLDRLAELSGVSKAMIGQIERGESNPTVNTLWKIAAGLHVSFAKLIAEDKPAAELVRFHEVEPLRDEENCMSMFPLFSFDQEKGFEIFSIVLESNCSHTSAPHIDGSEEYVLLIAGKLEIIVGPETYLLNQGDAIRFHADSAHIYRNPTNDTVRFQNIIYYG